MQNSKLSSEKSSIATVAIWSAALLWGGSFLATRVLVHEIPPLTAAVLRFAICSFLLLIGLWWKNGRFPMLHRSAWRKVALFGIFQVTLCFGLENVGLRRTSAGNASVLISLVPALSILAGWLFLKESLSQRQWLGVALASAGSLFLVTQGRSLGLSDPFGDFLLLGAAVMNAAANLIGKRNTDAVDPFLNLAYGFGIGAMLLMPFALSEWRSASTLWPSTSNGLLALFYLVVPSTVIAYPCFFYGLSKKTLSSASIPMYFLPVVTLCLAALFLHELLTSGRILAAGIEVFGLVLASIPRREERRTASVDLPQEVCSD